MRRIQHVSFGGSAGDQLAGRLDLPEGDPIAYALFAHCFTCSKEIPAATHITRSLVDHGIGVFRFDFTGLGASEGDFANTNFSSNVEDLVRAADMLRLRAAAPKVLVGHSLGGAAVLATAARIPEALAVVTIGAPFEPAEVTRLLPADVRTELDRSGEATAEIAGRSFPVRRQLVEDADAHDLTDAIRHLNRGLLVFHSPSDELVAVDNARRIFDVANHPKSFVSLDDADHLLTRRSDAVYVGQVLAGWVSRYLGTRAAPDRVVGAKGTVVVTTARDGKVAQEIRVGRHRVVADEPVPVGDDAGFTPHDLLLGSLGACTAMTLQLYAKRKGWPLEHVSVQLSREHVHAADGGEGATRPGMIERIDRVLDLDGPLTGEQRDRLVEIAERCPVHRTLVAEKQIITVLGEVE
jgi:putative redox protein